MKKIRVIYILVCMLMTQVAFSQTRKLVAEGNKLYEQKQYKQASDNYLKALSKDSTNIPGMFNLGNALLQQKQYDAARKVLSNSARLEQDKNGKAAAEYNIGNTYMAEQKWEEAIAAYKKALRNNPQDADAKYNLSYAQQMLKKNGGGGKDKNKKDKNKDKNKEDKDGKDKKDKQDDNGKPNEENKDNKDKKDDQQKPQSQPSKLTEKQAEQLLNALQQEEKKLQDKHKKAKGIPVKVEKDW